MSGAKGLVKGVLGLPGAILSGPKSPGTPPVQDDPEEVIAEEAIQGAIAGDIAVRNAQRQSSTLGSGANFLATSTEAGPGLQDTGPVGFVDQRPEVKSEAQLIMEEAKDAIGNQSATRNKSPQGAGTRRLSLSQRGLAR